MSDTTDPVASKIAQHGWAVVNVEGDTAQPAYSYSVGFTKAFDHPEVIVFGLPSDVLHQIINTIGRAVRSGRRFSENETSDEVLTGYVCAFRTVAPAAESTYMPAVFDFYGHEVPALHCIWPDREGHFPWERGTSAEYRMLQPMLSEGPEPFTHTRPESTA
jgi:hypothetical protein